MMTGASLRSLTEMEEGLIKRQVRRAVVGDPHRDFINAVRVRIRRVLEVEHAVGQDQFIAGAADTEYALVGPAYDAVSK